MIRSFEYQPLEERRPGNRQHADEHGDRGDLHLREEPAHLPQILFVMAAIDDAAGTKEEQCLEESMREQVQQPRDPAADAKGEHHVAELAARGIGQHPFDVGLDQRDRRTDE